jgi:hypothetical protein
VAESVTVRHAVTGEERRVRKGAVLHFVNQGFEVLDAAGRKKAKQPTPAASDNKEN